VFTASATVASRNPQVAVDDGANTIWAHDTAAAITNGQVAAIVGTGTNAPTGVVTTTQGFVLPPGLIMPSGYRVRMSTQNIQVGDQWSTINFLVEEWLDNV
jgi:hypothetical protein